MHVNILYHVVSYRDFNPLGMSGCAMGPSEAQRRRQHLPAKKKEIKKERKKERKKRMGKTSAAALNAGGRIQLNIAV